MNADSFEKALYHFVKIKIKNKTKQNKAQNQHFWWNFFFVNI